MPKKRWTATPIDAVSKRGDRHLLVCTLDSDPERYIDVDLGTIDEVNELIMSLESWRDHKPRDMSGDGRHVASETDPDRSPR